MSLFGLKKIIIGDFNNGIIPKFEVTNITLDQIHRGVNKNQAEYEDRQIQTKKQLRTAADFFASINRRYNKFKYAYYNKGANRMDKEKINKCFQKTQRFLNILNGMHRKLIAHGDPRAEKLGKKILEANAIVQKYGVAVIKLNENKCPRPKTITKGKVQGNRNKIRK